MQSAVPWIGDEPYVSDEIAEAQVRTAHKGERILAQHSNHPMLINCASANRVGAFMLVYRVLEQNWSEDKALEEATKIGLSSEGLKKFARDYIAQHKGSRG